MSSSDNHSHKHSNNVSPEGAGSFIHIDPYDNPSIIQHVRYTILWKIWPSMLFFTSLAIMLICLKEYLPDANPTIPPTMLTVLGTVLGFCISYRTSSAYERYIEGRRLWQQIQSSTRTFARLAWFHAPNALREKPEDETKEVEAAKALLEKKTILNLLEAYAVATKHYLRGETGIHYEDLYPLICFLPKYQLPNNTPIRRNDMPSLARSADSSAMLTAVDDSKTEDKIEVLNASATSSEQVRFRGNTKRQDTGTSFSSLDKPTYGPRNPDKKLLPAHNPPKMDIVDYFPILGLFRSAFKFGRKHVVSFFDEEAAAKNKLRKRTHKKEVYSGQNIPVELNMHLSNWISALQRRKTIDGTTASQFFTANASLAEALSGLERVLTTPLPFVYAIHLKHAVYVYMIALPFQVLQTLGWLTIPAVCIASFIFTGFLQIADDIEQPLGYDASDLDLAFFCMVIRKELRELVAQPVLSPEEFFFTPYNEPLAPNDVRSATELLDDEVTVEDIESAFRHKSDATVNRSFTEAHMIRKSREYSSEMNYLPTVKREEMV